MNEEEKQKLHQKLQSRISEKRITRYSKEQKKKVIVDTLKTMGIDSEEFMKNLDIVNNEQKRQSSKTAKYF